jgi:hypothetical protein
MDTVSAFPLVEILPYALCGCGLGILLGVLLVMWLRRSGRLLRRSGFWTAAVKAEYVWLPLAFAVGLAAVGSVFGMARLTSAFIGSDRIGVDARAARAVDAALEEMSAVNRGSGLGEEAFPEIARAAADAGARAVFASYDADEGYSRLLDRTRTRLARIMREYLVNSIAEAAAAGAVTDAAVLCDVARPRVEAALSGGAAVALARESADGLFTPLSLWAVALWAALLLPCVLEYLCHLVFRVAPVPEEAPVPDGPDEAGTVRKDAARPPARPPSRPARTSIEDEVDRWYEEDV